MAFCVSIAQFVYTNLQILTCSRRILEMQVIFCHLVSKFSFAEVEGESIRVRLFTTLVPIGPKGEKALPLRVARI
jgi:hypothetical protein